MAAQGPVGLMNAQRVAEITGKTPFVSAAAMPQEMFDRQMKRTSLLNSAFGLSPDQLERAGYATSNFFATVGQAFSLFWTKVGGSITEKLQPLFDKGLDWLVARSGVVGTAIERGVDAGYNALKKLGIFLYADFPVWAAQAGIGLLKLMQTASIGAVNLWNGVAGSTAGRALGLPSIIDPTGAGNQAGSVIGSAFGGGGTAGANGMPGGGVKEAGMGISAVLLALMRGRLVGGLGAAASNVFGSAAIGAGSFVPKMPGMLLSGTRLFNPITAGLTLGALGYDFLRNHGVIDPANLSTAQILQYGLYKATGINTMGGASSGAATQAASDAMKAAVGFGGGASSALMDHLGEGANGPGFLQGGINTLEAYLGSLRPDNAPAGMSTEDARRAYLEKQLALLERIANGVEKGTDKMATSEEIATEIRNGYHDIRQGERVSQFRSSFGVTR